MNGWIKLHRSLADHVLWSEKPFTRGQAWVDLLLLASHEDHTFFLGGSAIDVAEGEIVTSVQRLADRWGWSRKKVRLFLDNLQKGQMLEQKRAIEGAKKGTILFLVNWAKYQSQGPTKEQQKNNEGTTKAHIQEEKKKEDKKINIKAARRRYGEYQNVLLTDDEFSKLRSEFPEDWQRRIEDLSSYMQSTGKSYKGHLATMRNWARRSRKQETEEKKIEQQQRSLYAEQITIG